MKALAIGVAALVLVAGAQASQRATRNVAVFGMVGDIDGSFNTNLSCCNAIPGFYYTVPVLRGAFIQNTRGAWVKDLVSSARADRHGVTYTIRPDASWYWGGRKVPVTYRDFVYTLRELDDPANDIASRVGYANLDPTHYTHRGNRQVTLFWRTTACSTDYPCGPYADWPSLFSQLYPSFALAGLDFDKLWATCICGSDGKPVADGPYYLAEHTPGVDAVLKANPYYHTKPKLAEIDFKIVGADPGAITEAMRDGQVDAVFPSFAPDLLTLRTVAGLAYQIAPQYAIERIDLREGSAPGAASLTKGAQNVLLRAPWMRQAIMLALNRQAMIDDVYGPGTGLKPMDNLLYYRGEAGYRPDFARWSYDPAKAIAMLRRHCTGGPTAPDPATTKVWQCAGLPALFRYTWPSTAPARTIIEQVARTNLKAVGIAIADRPLPSGPVFTMIESGDYDLSQYAIFTSGDAGDWYDTFRCLGPENYTGYCSHTVDALLKAGNSALDPEKRALDFQRADAIMASQLPSLPLFQKPGTLIRKSGLIGPEPNPTNFGPFWNVEDWRWKR